MTETGTIIIGAGPAGLATAACLTRCGRPHLVFDRAPRVGESWRNHYARLHLHTVKACSGLPFLPFDRDVPQYPSREQVVAYLERYAEHFALAPRLGEGVEHAAFRDGGWEVRTAAGSYRAQHLVVATGYNAEPYEPSWPGEESFGGERLHSSRYRDGAAFRGRDVMVVGSGNSGAEIAIDLWEHGARTLLCIRGPIHVTRRDTLGIPAQRFGIALERLPAALADRIALAASRLAVGDLSHLGIRRPAMGPVSQVRQLGRVPMLDIGTVDLIRRGEVLVVPGIERFTARGVVFVDGTERPLDGLVLATGYRARLERFLEGAADLVDDRGYPRWHGAEVREGGRRGLFFLGFRNPISGMLREIHLEALRIASAIADAAA